jgi:histidyl-tRNA synthetase
MSTSAELNAAIVNQGNIVRKLKESKADADEITQGVQELKLLKGKLAALTGGGAEDGKKGGSKKATKFTLKTPKVRSRLFIRLFTNVLGAN